MWHVPLPGIDVSRAWKKQVVASAGALGLRCGAALRPAQESVLCDGGTVVPEPLVLQLGCMRHPGMGGLSSAAAPCKACQGRGALWCLERPAGFCQVDRLQEARVRDPEGPRGAPWGLGRRLAVGRPARWKEQAGERQGGQVPGGSSCGSQLPDEDGRWPCSFRPRDMQGDRLAGYPSFWCVCMCVCVRTRVMGEGGSLLPGGFVLCWFQALAEPRGGEDAPVAREKLRLRGSRDLATVLELRSATLASGERATVTLGSISVPGGTETDHAQSNCCEPWVGGVGGAGRTSR